MITTSCLQFGWPRLVVPNNNLKTYIEGVLK